MFYRLSPSPSVIGSSLYIPMSSLYGAGAGADVGAVAERLFAFRPKLVLRVCAYSAEYLMDVLSVSVVKLDRQQKII